MAAKGFNDAVEVILKNEGGFVNNIFDKGGATNWGITKAVYEAYKGRSVSVDEIKNMPRTDAVAIYKKNYWDKVGGDNIKYYATALTLFDQAVNRGVGAVVKQAQSVLGLTQDGGMGPQTLAALNAIPDTSFIPKFLAAAENSYKAIVANNPSQSVFIKGWLNRVEELRKQANKYLGELNGKTVGISVGVIALLGIGIYLYLNSKKGK